MATAVLLGAVVALAGPVASSPGSTSDPAGDAHETAVADIRAVYHDDNATQIIYWVESYSDFEFQVGSDIHNAAFTWFLDLNSDGADDCFVEAAPGSGKGVYCEFENRGGVSVSREPVPGSSTSTENNSLKVVVDRSVLPLGTSYRYYVEQHNAHSSTAEDRAPDAGFVTHVLDEEPPPEEPSPTIDSIQPTSGPIGTDITAHISGCMGGGNTNGTSDTSDDFARLDFSFRDDPNTAANEGTTPINTTFFVPASDGTATVTIEAMDREGTENSTLAEVVLSQCANAGEDSAPFTVTRGGSPPPPPPAQETAPGFVSDTTVDPGQSVEIFGDGFAPNQDLQVTFFSDPVSLGTVRSDANGAYRASVTIPLGAAPGDHTIVVSGQSAHGGSRRTEAAVAVRDLDCSDFRTQQDAQRVYDANRSDPHRLDADNDGRACETLPATAAGGGLPRSGGSLPVTGSAALRLAVVAMFALMIGGVSTGLVQRHRLGGRAAVVAASDALNRTLR